MNVFAAAAKECSRRQGNVESVKYLARLLPPPLLILQSCSCLLFP